MSQAMQHVGLNMVRGAAASVPGSTLMGASMLTFRRLGLLGEPPPKKLTRKFMGLIGRSGLTFGPQLDATTVISHLAYGAVSGALFGAVAGTIRSPGARLLAGVGFGAAVWAVSYAGWIPSIGLMSKPKRDRPGRPTSMLLTHVVFGAVLGALFKPRARAERSTPLTQAELVDRALGARLPVGHKVAVTTATTPAPDHALDAAHARP